MFGFINNRKQQNEEIFVVIIMAYLGDALVGNSLFQNIKRIYPNSKTVFIINKPYYEIAKYQKDVDEVVVYDKNGEHKGFIGLFKFVKNFPYKKIKYVFKMCQKSRVDAISLLLKPQKIINYKHDISLSPQDRFNSLLRKVTKEEVIELPIVYNATDDIPVSLQNLLVKDKKYIALCPISSNEIKDMPLSTSIDLINRLVLANYEVLLVGVGERTEKYASELEENNCKFINLVNKTSIYELAQTLRNCKALISVDTGTMHIGYASGVPTVCLFYVENNIKGWAPDQVLYPHTVVPTNKNPQNIFDACMQIVGK